MGRFKPVIRTQVVPAVTNTTSTNNNNKNNNSTAPLTPPHNDNVQSTEPTVVNVSTQKGRKNQKVSDGQIKKVTTPRKRKNKKTVAAKSTVEEASTEKISNSDETKPNVAMPTPEGSAAASAPDNVSPASNTTTKATRKRKSKSNKNDNLQAEANNNKGESKPKRARKAKDPNAPKRPSNAYFQYSSVKRTELKQQNPGMSSKEITTMLGETWRKMSEAEKKPYYDLVTQALAQWQEDMKAYQALNNVEFIQEQNMAQTKTNESVDICPSSGVPVQDNLQLVSQNGIELQLVSDNGINNLPEIIASNNTIDGLYQLPANSTCVSYNSYGQQDSMEDLLDMPDNSQAYGYHPTNTDTNGTHLYMDNTNTNYSLSSTMIPIQVGIVDQDAHGSYYTQDFITTHQEREQNQVAKQDLLLCQPFDPSGANQKELESNAQENPVIQKQEKPDTNNMLLCQPFEPSNNKDNDNDDNSWLQDETHGMQYQDQHTFPNQQTQQEYSESIMYSQIQYEQTSQQFSSQEHAFQHPVHQQEILHQELQHVEMYQHSHNSVSEW